MQQGMTRQEILYLLLVQAKANGFQFRKWYCSCLEPEWVDFERSLSNIATGKKYYALLFSHDFAQCFWKPGAQISFIVPTASYTRKNKQGELITITRKAFTRRTLKEDSWRYHLREMVAAEEPLRYIRRFIVRREDLESYRAALPSAVDRSFAEEGDQPIRPA